jgi:uncharacterized protein YggE
MPVKFSVPQRSLLTGAAAAALLIASFLLGAGRGSAAASATQTAPGARITVTGTGTATGVPDQLLLSMGVQTRGESVAAALQRANEAVRAITAALARSGVPAADVQTSGLSIQPDYASPASAPSGYGVSESLQITLRHLSAAGSQISAAARAGGNATTVDGVSLNLTDSSALLGSARAGAVRDARAKAGQEARALGRALGPVISISEPAPAEPLPLYAAPGSAASSAKPVPVSPGTQQLSVTVTAVFALA